MSPSPLPGLSPIVAPSATNPTQTSSASPSSPSETFIASASILTPSTTSASTSSNATITSSTPSPSPSPSSSTEATKATATTMTTIKTKQTLTPPPKSPPKSPSKSPPTSSSALSSPVPSTSITMTFAISTPTSQQTISNSTLSNEITTNSKTASPIINHEKSISPLPSTSSALALMQTNSVSLSPEDMEAANNLVSLGRIQIKRELDDSSNCSDNMLIKEIKSEINCSSSTSSVCNYNDDQSMNTDIEDTSSTATTNFSTDDNNDNKCNTNINHNNNNNNNNENNNENKVDNDNDNKVDNDNDNDNNDTIDLLNKPRRKILLNTINPQITCNICKGYLIDATTIVECLHSFCHSCIMRHLRKEQYCPRCEMMINTAKPNIKPDTTLQAIVYKLVPGLYELELMRKREFYRNRPEEAALATPEQRGDDTEHLIFSPSEYMSLSLEFADIEQLASSENDNKILLKPKYLRCPAFFTVYHMKKFVIGKYDIDSNRFVVEIMYKVKTIVLLDHYTLMDVAYIYTWKRDAPMRFFFRVKQNGNFIEKPRAMIKMPTFITDSPIGKVKVVKQERLMAIQEMNNFNQMDVNKSENLIKIKCEKPDYLLESSTNFNEKDDKPFMTEQPQIKSLSEDINMSNKTFEIIPSPPQHCSNSLANGNSEPKTEKLKIKLIHNNKQSKIASYSIDSPNVKVKEQKHSKNSYSNSNSNSSSNLNGSNGKKTLSPPVEKDERKVENIKLKIDLSKQNSVTIINMSDPERKEIIKPVKPEKEWKVKSSKRDKEERHSGTLKGTLSEKKHKNDEKRKNLSLGPLTVPPLTIKADRMSPITKYSTCKSPSSLYTAAISPKREESTKSKVEMDEEQKKSQFLECFALLPTKLVKSPEKPKSFSIVKPPTMTQPTTSPTKSLMGPPLSLPPAKSTMLSKRKSKEPIKLIAAKQQKTELLGSPSNEFKMPKIPKIISTLNNLKAQGVVKNDKSKLQNNVDKKKPDDQLMPAPPSIPKLLQKKKNLKPLKKTLLKTGEKTFTPNYGLPPPSPYIAPPGSRTPHPNVLPPLPSAMVTPGNRTPIAKRFQPILPKGGRPNPFASIPSDTSKILQDNGTEVKSIFSGENTCSKIYGPKPIQTSCNASSPTTNSTPMGPPAPINSSSSNSNNVTKTTSSSNYLSYALFNANKTRGNEAPPGCRTPIYTPQSPIYSPNSPQYMPNYNIPSQSTFKYTTKPTVQRNTFLQNVLGTRNNHLSGLFPSAPTKKTETNSYSPPLSNPLTNLFPTPPIKKIESKSSTSPPLLNTSMNLFPTGPIHKLDNKTPSPPPAKPTTPTPSAPPSPYNPSKMKETNESMTNGNNNNNNNINNNDLSNCGSNAPKRVYAFSTSPTGELDAPEKQIKVKSLLTSCNINIPSSLSITITNEDSESKAKNANNMKHKSPVNNYIEILKLPEKPNDNYRPPSLTQMNSNKNINGMQQQFLNNAKEDITKRNISTPFNNSINQFNNMKSGLITYFTNNEKEINNFGKRPSDALNQDLTKCDPTKQNLSKSEQPKPDITKTEQSKNLSPDLNQTSKKFRPILPRTGSPIPPRVVSMKKKELTALRRKERKLALAKANPPKNRGRPKKDPNVVPKSTWHLNKTTPLLPKSPTTPNLQDNNNKNTQNVSPTLSNQQQTSPTNQTPNVKSPASSPGVKTSNAITTSMPPPPTTISPDVANFLNETILRAHVVQAQAAIACGVSPNILFPMQSNFNQFSPVYNLQQTYIMEQLTRMQKAGHDVLERYRREMKAAERMAALTASLSAGSPSSTGSTTENSLQITNVTTPLSSPSPPSSNSTALVSETATNKAK